MVGNWDWAVHRRWDCIWFESDVKRLLVWHGFLVLMQWGSRWGGQEVLLAIGSHKEHSLAVAHLRLWREGLESPVGSAEDLSSLLPTNRTPVHFGQCIQPDGSHWQPVLCGAAGHP